MSPPISTPVENGVLLDNTDQSLGWIVQKFGGTSVGKFAEKIAEDVVRYVALPRLMSSHMTGNRIALVCSARSSASKEDGTTNRLLKAAEEALRTGSGEHIGIVEAIRVDHVDAARELIADQEIMERVVREIEFECKRLEDFLNAAQVRFSK
jgi:aspartate kinase